LEFEFSSLYLHSHFINSIKIVLDAKKLIYNNLLPFLLNVQGKTIDYYCFDTSTKKPDYEVVLFAVHAIVFSWKNYQEWLVWSNQKNNKLKNNNYF
jgi:hypothetical protein